MSTVLASWIAAATVLLGLGCLARREAPTVGGLPATFWLGWAWTMAALQLWHMVLPVDARFTCAAALAGAIGLLRGRSALRAALRGHLLRPGGALLTAGAAVWLAARALGPDLNGDDGLYHLLSVRWAATQPVVPGLVNLQRCHPNQVMHLFAAALDVGPLAHRSFHVVNGLFVIAILGQAAGGLRALVRARGRPALHRVLAAVFLAPAIDLALGRDLTSVTPDLLVFAVGFALVVRTVAMLEQGGGLAEADLLELTALGSAAVVAKLATAPLVAGVLALAVARLARGRPAGLGKTLGRSVALASLFILVFFLRGVVTTGYPAWPAAVAGAPVDWRVPLAEARGEAAYLRALGRGTVRASDAPPEDAAWFERWIGQLAMENRRVVLPLGFVLLFGLGAAGLRWRGGQGPPVLTGWAIAPVLAALGIWAVTLPDLRYAGALPWLLAGFAAAFGAARLPAAALDNYLRAIALASVICALWPLAEESARALPDVTELTAAPIPVVQPYRTRSGSIVSVPVSGTCWDAPPPCTIAPRADLTERVVGAPASGYRIEAGP